MDTHSDALETQAESGSPIKTNADDPNISRSNAEPAKSSLPQKRAAITPVSDSKKPRIYQADKSGSSSDEQTGMAHVTQLDVVGPENKPSSCLQTEKNRATTPTVRNRGVRDLTSKEQSTPELHLKDKVMDPKTATQATKKPKAVMMITAGEQLSPTERDMIEYVTEKYTLMQKIKVPPSIVQSIAKLHLSSLSEHEPQLSAKEEAKSNCMRWFVMLINKEANLYSLTYQDKMKIWTLVWENCVELQFYIQRSRSYQWNLTVDGNKGGNVETEIPNIRYGGGAKGKNGKGVAGGASKGGKAILLQDFAEKASVSYALQKDGTRQQHALSFLAEHGRRPSEHI
jgi:hypothetical protein